MGCNVHVTTTAMTVIGSIFLFGSTVTFIYFGIEVVQPYNNLNGFEYCFSCCHVESSNYTGERMTCNCEGDSNCVSTYPCVITTVSYYFGNKMINTTLYDTPHDMWETPELQLMINKYMR